MTARVAPFAAYLAFLLLGDLVQWTAADVSWLSEQGGLALWLYPVKITVVLALLLYFWPQYHELRGSQGPRAPLSWAILTGILVFLAWVRLDWDWAVLARSEGYNPLRAARPWAEVLIGVRLLGAAVVVPLMEELFWRSFLLRYLITPRFERVRIGTFTPFSFVATLVLFAVEHDLWLAGLVAGAAYTLLLYRTQRLWDCILAHGLTNLLLGLHVVRTEEWRWW